jgi:hypothetical protein
MAAPSWGLLGRPYGMPSTALRQLYSQNIALKRNERFEVLERGFRAERWFPSPPFSAGYGGGGYGYGGDYGGAYFPPFEFLV